MAPRHKEAVDPAPPVDDPSIDRTTAEAPRRSTRPKNTTQTFDRRQEHFEKTLSKPTKKRKQKVTTVDSDTAANGLAPVPKQKAR